MTSLAVSLDYPSVAGLLSRMTGQKVCAAQAILSHLNIMASVANINLTVVL